MTASTNRVKPEKQRPLETTSRSLRVQKYSLFPHPTIPKTYDFPLILFDRHILFPYIEVKSGIRYY